MVRAIALTFAIAVTLGVASGAQASAVTVTESRPAVVRAAGATVSVTLGPARIRLRASSRRGLRAVVTERRRGRRARRVSIRLPRLKSKTVVLARLRSQRQSILLRLRTPGARPRDFQIDVAGAHAPSKRAPSVELVPKPGGLPAMRVPEPSPPGDAEASPPLAPPSPDRLRWEQPDLADPADVYVSASNRALRLDPARDYVVHMPVLPLSASGGLTITGGRNVVLIGGQISIPWQGASPQGHERRGLLLRNQRGTIHVEGLLIDGPDVSEGINLDQGLGATVQFANLRVENLHARDEVHFTDTHPDVIQTWNGPDRLLVDRLTGSSDYQGFFLRPQEKGGPPPTLFSFSNVNLIGTETAGNLLWKASEFPIETSETWVSPNPRKTMNATLWPSPAAWPGVQKGVPPSGDFVAAGEAGTTYASPGFVVSAPAAAGTRCHYLSTVGPAPASRHCE
jgi:hypothetical protein